MKALAICQPYAHLIMRGDKLVENRTWPTSYRGPLLIHAGKSHKFLRLDPQGLYDLDYRIPVEHMSFGEILGVVDLVECIEVKKLPMRIGKRIPYPNLTIDEMRNLLTHKHTEGPFAFVLKNPRWFRKRISYRGQQGMFNVPEGITANQMEKI